MLITPEGFLPRLDTDEDDRDGYCFVVHAGRLLVTRGETPSLPSTDEPALCSHPTAAVHYFGDYDGKPCRVFVLDAAGPFDEQNERYEWKGLRALFGALPDAEVGLAGRAMQLAEWTRTHRCCGCCGTAMSRQPGERAMLCPACGFTAYPRIAPAMMVLVKNDDKILLGRAPHFVPGVYSALAGFVEAGESLEECVHREVDEEVGISVHNLHYFCSQSWPFPHSLMLAFVADYVGGEIRPNPAELSDARWFSVDELPKLPGKISISRALIDSVIDDIRSRQPA